MIGRFVYTSNDVTSQSVMFRLDVLFFYLCWNSLLLVSHQPMISLSVDHALVCLGILLSNRMKGNLRSTVKESLWGTIVYGCKL